jgi:hypothetical protein
MKMASRLIRYAFTLCTCIANCMLDNCSLSNEVVDLAISSTDNAVTRLLRIIGHCSVLVIAILKCRVGLIALRGRKDGSANVMESQ